MMPLDASLGAFFSRAIISSKSNGRQPPSTFQMLQIGSSPHQATLPFLGQKESFHRTTVKDIASLLRTTAGGGRNQCTLFQVNKWQKSIIFNFQLDILVFTYQGESDGFLIEVMQLHAIKILPSLKVSHWLLSVHW